MEVREECEGFGIPRVRIVRFTCGITMRYLVDMTRSAIISHRDSIAYVVSLVPVIKLSDIDRDFPSEASHPIMLISPDQGTSASSTNHSHP
jgi:hypothetical protein